jgi:hypothetical protein
LESARGAAIVKDQVEELAWLRKQLDSTGGVDLLGDYGAGHGSDRHVKGPGIGDGQGAVCDGCWLQQPAVEAGSPPPYTCLWRDAISQRYLEGGGVVKVAKALATAIIAQVKREVLGLDVVPNELGALDLCPARC